MHRLFLSITLFSALLAPGCAALLDVLHDTSRATTQAANSGAGRALAATVPWGEVIRYGIAAIAGILLHVSNRRTAQPVSRPGHAPRQLKNGKASTPRRSPDVRPPPPPSSP